MDDKIFFTEVRSTAGCLISQESVAVFKDYNIITLPQSMQTTQASSQRKNMQPLQRLAAHLQAQQNWFHRQIAFQDTSTKASFLLAFKRAKPSKPLSYIHQPWMKVMT